MKKPLKTYTEIFGSYMVQRAAVDPQVVAITAAMTSGTGLADFSAAYPDRFFDVGICEQHAVTMAAGMAKMGLRPVVAVYSTFLQRAYDQVIHDVALQNLPVLFAIDRAGLVGEDGPTHHGVFDLTYLRSIPNLTLMAPADEADFIHMLDTAFTINGPTAIRYPRGVVEQLSLRENQLPGPGRSRLLQGGRDLLIIAIGRGVGMACDAARSLNQLGVSAAVMDARFVKPLDQEAVVTQARQLSKVVTIEDNSLQGGFGSSVLETLQAAGGVAAEVLTIGIPDEFVEHGRVDLLMECLGMDAASIVESILTRWPQLIKQPSELGIIRFGKN